MPVRQIAQRYGRLDRMLGHLVFITPLAWVVCAATASANFTLSSDAARAVIGYGPLPYRTFDDFVRRLGSHAQFLPVALIGTGSAILCVAAEDGAESLDGRRLWMFVAAWSFVVVYFTNGAIYPFILSMASIAAWIVTLAFSLLSTAFYTAVTRITLPCRVKLCSLFER